MSTTVTNAVIQPEATQMYLRSRLVVDRIAKTRFPEFVRKGQQIDFDYDDGVTVGDYTYGTGVTTGDTTITNDNYTITTPVSASFMYDPLQNKTTKDPNWKAGKAQEIAYQLSRRIDQYGLGVGIDNAFATLAAGSLSASNMMELLVESDARLTENLAMPGMRFIVLDPMRKAILPLMDAANGFETADDALMMGMNGYEGKTSAGLHVFTSNELPYSVTLDLTTNPTAGDTLTLFGRTWTFVLNGTAASAGDISIAGSAAATQAIVVNAINGTGTPGASTYIDFSTKIRKSLSNTQLTAGAFAANVSTITSKGRMNASDTLTATSEGFGTETFSMLAGVVGALDLTIQARPLIEEKDVVSTTTVSHAKQVLGTTQFGAGVFENYKPSLLKITANAAF